VDWFKKAFPGVSGKTEKIMADIWVFGVLAGIRT
jgi:hypothetical protein